MKILCRTLFDCTYTGVTGNFRVNQLPFEDQSGKSIVSYNDWNFARNQQRNWETIMQMISLRAQPTMSQYPEQQQDVWEFIFEVETPGVYSADGTVDNYDTLLNECHGIPMLTGLTEKSTLAPQLTARGQQQNIWFESVNKSLEHTDG
jgi:hypothetical protein